MKTVVAIFAMGAGVLAGCGDSDSNSSSAYCEALKDLGGGSYVPNTASSETVPKMRKIAEVAPDEIKADWKRLADAQEQLMSSAAGSPSAASAPADIGLVAQRLVTFNEKTCMK
ncbi:hypothetical protein ACFQZZ_02220 [Nocardia sp. GCM10030253]|uniref:hypothetical protein n=1 Tax=Nocardia sp. GCM10030253 TaxID=3273404 RepID=UPI00362D3121